MKGVVTIVLLLFVTVSVAYLVVSEARSTTTTTDPATRGAGPSQPVANESLSATNKTAIEKQSPVLVAYYFHGTSRCATCLKMEKYAREAIEDAYQAEVGSGRVRWQAINYDEPANEHFVKDYGLLASSLVIVSGEAVPSGVWRKMDRIWDLIGDE